jgi:hypothetical protein
MARVMGQVWAGAVVLPRVALFGLGFVVPFFELHFFYLLNSGGAATTAQVVIHNERLLGQFWRVLVVRGLVTDWTAEVLELLGPVFVGDPVLAPQAIDGTLDEFRVENVQLQSNREREFPEERNVLGCFTVHPIVISIEADLIKWT